MPIKEDMLSVTHFKVLMLTVQDLALTITVSFTGGPIRLLYRSATLPPTVVEFAADPFFRTTDSYLAAGSIVLSGHEYSNKTTCEVVINLANQHKTDGGLGKGHIEVVSTHRALSGESVVLYSADVTVTSGTCESLNLHLIGANVLS
jgi:hypothetical protein